MSDIKLGLTVRDKISGLEGTVTRRVTTIDGSIMFAIQPRVAKDNEKHPRAVSIDEAQIEVIGAGPGVPAQPYSDDVKINLGEKVEDVITGAVGIAVTRHDFLNGCAYLEVQGECGKDAKVPAPDWFPHFRLKKIGQGITKMLPKPAPATATAAPKKAPGGPSIELDNNYARER